MNDETILRYSEDFLRTDKYRRLITEAGNAYPETKSVEVDFSDLDESNSDLAEYVLKHPQHAIGIVEEAVLKILPPDIQNPLHVRFYNLPPLYKLSINHIRDEDVGKLAEISGIVTKASQPLTRYVEATFRCGRCGYDNIVPQGDYFLKEPIVCEGCNRGPNQTSYDLIEDMSKRVDYQELQIQSTPEDSEGAIINQSLKVFAESDLAGELQPGDRCTITGAIFTIPRIRGKSKTTIHEFYLAANHIIKHDTTYMDIEITQEDEIGILKLSKDPDIYSKLVESIAPSIHGNETIKLALVLQQFGGIRRTMTDGSNLRGDIHILLIGDPGTAKSQLLRIISQVAPRAILASGQATTKAGLTAAAVKDEGGRWTFEAGALPLADGGMACVDELDKMNSSDRSAMHEAMEQQEISIHKAGLNLTLYTRCPILAAANPRHGRFDENDSFAAQVNLPPTLLTRFDLIFPFVDAPNKTEDEAIVDQLIKDFELGGNTVPISSDTIKKYIAYAKEHCTPDLTEEAKHKLREFYIKLRYESRDVIQITPRQFLALLRLAAASAKVRLSEKIELEDAERAIRIYAHAISKIAFEDGFFNIDYIETGKHKPMHTIIPKIRSAIQKTAHNSVDGSFSLNELMLNLNNISRKIVEDALTKFTEDGELYEHHTGRYKLV